VSGVPDRTKIIDEFLTYAKGFSGAWFARRIAIANGASSRATRPG
jgi:hypothetical protein